MPCAALYGGTGSGAMSAAGQRRVIRRSRASAGSAEVRIVADDGLDAFSVAATSIDFGVPDKSVFDFRPPAGVKVTEHDGDDDPAAPEAKDKELPKTVGTGWATVALLEVPDADSEGQQQADVFLDSLPVVSGEWGKGRLLSTSLLNAVITDDGRVAVGSVVPERLYAALKK